MSVIDTLITNRTGGYYGIEDLNRVGEAMYYIAERLRSFGFAITVNSRTDWKLTDRVSESEANLYLTNLRKLRAALNMLSTTPDAPSGTAPFNLQEANAIEKILVDVEDSINRIPLSFFYGGEICCGEAGQ